MKTPSNRSRAGALWLASAAAFVVAASAHATGVSGAPGSSAIAQYVEMVPTGTGDQPLGAASQPDTKLPAKLKHTIEAQGGSDASELVAVASSPTYGAPPPEPAPTPAVQPTPRANPTKPTKPAKTAKPTTASTPPAQPVVRSLGELVPAASIGRTLAGVVPATTGGTMLATWLGLLLVAAAAGAVVVSRRRSASPGGQ
jgi:hypothetical protein